MEKQIQIYNRRCNVMEIETIYGRRWMEAGYSSAPGRRFTSLLLARRPLSVLYGCLQRHPASRRKINDFIEQYQIDMDQVIIPPGGFGSFNDFFIRRLKPDARPIAPDPGKFISPADSRLQAFTLDSPGTAIKVKGIDISLPGLLGLTPHKPPQKLPQRLPQRLPWDNGTVLVFRLAPCDFHRFGHVTDGIQGPVHSIRGNFHSVNPLAMQHKPDVLMTNFRQWCFVQSPIWGTLIQVEVGAMMVGSVVQNLPQGGPCSRGQEKGYFQFGGSSVVIVLEPNRIKVDEDIQRLSRRGIETLVRYGESIGRRR